MCTFLKVQLLFDRCLQRILATWLTIYQRPMSTDVHRDFCPRVLLDNFSSKLQLFRQVVLPPSLPVPLWRHNLSGRRCHRVASAIPGTPGTIVLLWHNLLGYVGDVPLLSRELQVAVGSRPSAGALTTAWTVSDSLFRLTFWNIFGRWRLTCLKSKSDFWGFWGGFWNIFENVVRSMYG